MTDLVPTAVNDDKFTNFIDEVTNSEQVFVLKDKDEYAYTISTEFEKNIIETDEEEEDDVEVFCFWSSEEAAKVCQIAEWEHYVVERISLSDFLEEWCVGMFNDQMLAGLNFDIEMEGYESEILYLMTEIVKQLEEKGKKLRFKRFNNLTDLRDHIDEVLNIN